MLEVKVERCAGIDVGKKVLAVCIMIGLAHQKPTVEVRRFGMNVMELERLRVWLKEMGCTEAMMEALVEKKLNAAEIAELAHGRLRQKMPQIAEALEGHRMTDHHRFLIGQCLKHMQYIDEMIGDLDKQIQEKLRSYSKQVQLACTVPGIAPVAAASILAEIGMDMSPEGPFPDCHHLASWAAICPGNNES